MVGLRCSLVSGRLKSVLLDELLVNQGSGLLLEAAKGLLALAFVEEGRLDFFDRQYVFPWAGLGQGLCGLGRCILLSAVLLWTMGTSYGLHPRSYHPILGVYVRCCSYQCVYNAASKDCLRLVQATVAWFARTRFFPCKAKCGTT